MTKRALRLLILILVLAVAAAIYAALTLPSKDSTDETETKEESIPLTDFDPAEITSLRWNYQGEKYELELGQDGSWQWTADPACPISTEQAENLIRTLAAASASRRVTDAADKAEYGLDAPQFEYAACDEVGAETVLRLGDYSSYAMGYYADVNGGSEVYVVPYGIVENFARTPVDMIRTESVPDLTNAVSLTVISGGKTLTCRYYADSSGMSYSAQHHWFAGSGDQQQALSGSMMNSLLYSLTNLEWQSCVTYKATEEERETCGLRGDPCVRVTAEYSGENGARKSFTLLLGKYEGSSCYAAIEGSSMIYTVSGDVADSFIFLDAKSLAATDVCLVDLQEAGFFTVSADGASAEFLYAGEENGTDAAGELISVAVWQSGQKKIDAVTVEDFGAALAGLEAVSGAHAYDSRGTLAGILIGSGEEKPIELRFCVYSSSQMLVIRDQNAYLVDAADGQKAVNLALRLLDAAK